MGEKTNLVPFGSYEIESAQSERSVLDKEGSGEFLKIPVGRTQIRILPPPAGQKTPFVVVHQHYIQMPGDDKPIVFVCPRVSSRGKKHCPACEKAEEMYRSSNPMDRKRGQALFPKRRVFCNVIDRKDPEAGSKPFAFGYQIHDQLVNYREDPEDSVDFTHPEEGCDIVIKRKGTSKNDTEYKVILHDRGRKSPLADTVEEMNDLITGQKDLARYTAIPGEEEIIDMLEGNRPSRGDRELPSDTGRGRRRNRDDDDDDRRSRRRRTAADDVQDAEFEEVNKDEDDDF